MSLRKPIQIGLWFCGIFIVFQLTSGCFSFRMSQKEVSNHFEGSSFSPTLQKYTISERTINYASIGYDSLPTVIFFHGAPGSWSAFISFFEDTDLIKQAYLVSVDRPGYGYSNFGNSVTSMAEQADLLQPLLKRYEHTPTILVGHSLGGPVIARLSMDFPNLVDGLIFVAPSIDPDLEPDEDWFRAPLHTPFLRWLLPTSFQVTNDEIYFLEDELRKMLPKWQDITANSIVIQGGNDRLVDPLNAAFAKRVLINAPFEMIYIEDMNHFIPWNRPELIKNAIQDQLNVLSKESGRILNQP